MPRGAGAVERPRGGTGRPDALFLDPAVLPMTRAPGFENVLRGRVAESQGGLTAVELTVGGRLLVPGHDLRPGAEAVVAVRADDLILAVERPMGLSAQNILAGTIGEIRETEPDVAADRSVWVFVVLGPAGAPLVARITAQSCRQLDLAAGQSVHLVCKAQSCRLIAVG